MGADLDLLVLDEDRIPDSMVVPRAVLRVPRRKELRAKIEALQQNARGYRVVFEGPIIRDRCRYGNPLKSVSSEKLAEVIDAYAVEMKPKTSKGRTILLGIAYMLMSMGPKSETILYWR